MSNCRGGEDDLLELCQKARSLWLENKKGNLETVERIYREVWTSGPRKQESKQAAAERDDAPATKKPKVLQSEEEENTNYKREQQQQQQAAGEKLALILLQSGRPKEADAILEQLGYTCRLSEAVLNYNNIIMTEDVLPPAKSTTNKASFTVGNIPCCVFDNFLTPSELQWLQSVFLDPAGYWTEHNYQVEPPSPYFSYVIPLKTTTETEGGVQEESRISRFVQRLQEFLDLKQATYVEMWAHNRPHATGHQFHFDSDNEGCTGTVIRNPICSCVLYLSEEEHVGGPSIVTNQRLASRTLANTRGWSCPPRPGRLVAFDGKVLHGVVPGKGNYLPTTTASTDRLRRVTVMFAFWRRIRVRNNDSPGAARPFPSTSNKQQQPLPEWARLLLQTSQMNNKNTTTSTDEAEEATVPIPRQPLPLDHVYESVLDGGGKPWTRNMGFPDYEQIFQGF